MIDTVDLKKSDSRADPVMSSSLNTESQQPVQKIQLHEKGRALKSGDGSTSGNLTLDSFSDDHFERPPSVLNRSSIHDTNDVKSHTPQAANYNTSPSFLSPYSGTDPDNNNPHYFYYNNNTRSSGDESSYRNNSKNSPYDNNRSNSNHNSIRNTDSNNNRYSMVSEYSGVVHEGTEVSYVVKNPSADLLSSIDNRNHDKEKKSAINQMREEELVIKQIKHAKPVSRFNSTNSQTPSKPSRVKYQSDPSLLVNQVNHELKKLTINNHTDNEIIDSFQQNRYNSSNHNTSSSIQSSIIPPLETTVPTRTVIDPTRSETSGIIPTVPPRNKNRPKTMLLDENNNDLYTNLNDTSSVANSELSKPIGIPDQQTDEESNNKKKKKKKNRGKSHKKKNASASFDANTLSQLLEMANGTLIGSEFSDLGMQIEEKRALERLVDSLSRLTADMVLDPERYDEGLKRLKKAIKALEGF